MYKVLYYYTKKYWDYEYFRFSCDFWAELDHLNFTPKFHTLYTIGNIVYRYKLPIGNSLHRCILTYKYNNYFPISHDYYTDFTYLTQNN